MEDRSVACGAFHFNWKNRWGQVLQSYICRSGVGEIVTLGSFPPESPKGAARGVRSCNHTFVPIVLFAAFAYRRIVKMGMIGDLFQGMSV